MISAAVSAANLFIVRNRVEQLLGLEHRKGTGFCDVKAVLDPLVDVDD